MEVGSMSKQETRGIHVCVCGKGVAQQKKRPMIDDRRSENKSTVERI
jgi:hypothetical protein